MLYSLLAIQSLVAIGLVLGLSVITERASPKLAGLLAGLPIATPIILFFIGLENGTSFASDAAVYNLAGLFAMQFLLFVYYKASSGKNILLPAVLSVIGYFLAVCLLQLLALDQLAAVLLAILSIALFTYLFREIENSRIKARVTTGLAMLLGRALAAAVIILAVTGTATLAGPEWTGLFSAFPTTVFPLILIVHYTYGAKPVHTIIKNFPTGLAATLVYSFIVSFAYPAFGIYWGTVAAYAAVFVVCVMIYLLHARKQGFMTGLMN